MPTSSSSSRARCRACSGRMRRWRRRASMIWSPTGRVGLRLAMGSWKSMAACGPRTARICRSLQGTMSRPSSRMRPEMRALSGSRRRMERQSTDLPQPGFAHDGQGLPGVQFQIDAAHGLYLSGGGGEGDVQVFQLQQGRHGRNGVEVGEGPGQRTARERQPRPRLFPAAIRPVRRVRFGTGGRRTADDGAPRPACGRRHPRQKHLPAASSAAGSSLRCST